MGVGVVHTHRGFPSIHHHKLLQSLAQLNLRMYVLIVQWSKPLLIIIAYFFSHAASPWYIICVCGGRSLKGDIYYTVLLPPKINQIQALTMLVMSTMYTSLLFAPLRFPPNSTAWWSSYLVKEKAAQGGGLVPVTLGEDHVPERNKRGWLLSVLSV